MELESKFRIVENGKRIFGKGPCLLLETVGRLGSLNKAANEMNMSYSKPWAVINRAEKALGYSLLETRAGGRDGGGSYLTAEAEELIKAYKGFCEEAEKNVENIYNRYFKDTW